MCVKKYYTINDSLQNHIKHKQRNTSVTSKIYLDCQKLRCLFSGEIAFMSHYSVHVHVYY